MTVRQGKPKLETFGANEFIKFYREKLTGLPDTPIRFTRLEMLVEFGATMPVCPKRGSKIWKSRIVEKIAR